MVKADTIAIIPARGGSKRIPRKNLIDFDGKPLIAWSIEAALETGLFSRVLVSTDNKEIASVSRDFGASVPFLREVAADDTSPVSDATIAGLKQASVFWQEEYETVVQLMPNCPLRGGSDITLALDQFRKTGAMSQVSCFRFGWMNPWWAVSLDLEGRPKRLFGDRHLARSQDLEDLYCPTGAIWIAEVDALLSSGSFYGPDHRFFPMPWMRAVDIDEYEDVEMAKAVKIVLGEMSLIGSDESGCSPRSPESVRGDGVPNPNSLI